MQVSQAVNAWRDLTDAAATAAEAEAEAQGATRPSQDIRATVGMTGVTTVNARLASPSAVSSAIARSAAPSAAPTAAAAAAADDDDSDDGLELVGEQTLDEVLAVRVQLFSVPKRLFQLRNVIPTLEIYTQNCLGTVKACFYIVEMF